ncbi:hypothetical protein B0T22DRAFT_290069 [Podospora appendiculata]|uniref:Uncharacterized protein n=1 Tax=Podospora appendiculata TaxID=314037 RepID=A0AAE0X133_9PEZI|nr:hypothetical protein B0T22DRAFT_290069 [Podospora appendiculata]
MADVINQFTIQQHSALEDQKAHYRKKIKGLVDDIKKGSDKIRLHMRQLDAQNREIKSLQDSKLQMANRIKEMEAEATLSAESIRKIEEKYHICKQHLNSAIDEQQDLYNRSKKHWQNTIEEVRATERAQNTAMEMMRQKAEVIREQMLEKVRHAVAQNKHEARDLYRQISDLTRQLEEKDIELRQEKKAYETLSHKLQDLEAATRGFEALATQNNEILGRLNELENLADEQTKKSDEDARAKLDGVVERLDNLLKVSSDQQQLLSGVDEFYHKSSSTVNYQLETIMESQVTAKESSGKLATDLENHMEKLWQRLENQHEALSNQLKEKCEENGMLSSIFKAEQAKCQEANEELNKLKELVAAQEGEMRHLEENLDDMDASNLEIKEKARALELEVRRLAEDLESKTASAADLERSLRAKDESHQSETQQFAAQILKLNQQMQDKETASKLAASKELEIARREVHMEMEKSEADVRRLLYATQQERNTMAEQLNKFEQDAFNKEQAARQSSNTINSLKERLTSAQKEFKTTTEEFKERVLKLEQAHRQESARVESLEADLVLSRKRELELQEEAGRRDANTQAFFNSLQLVAQREGLVGLNKSLMDVCQSKAGLEEMGQQITQVAEQLILSRQPQTITRSGKPKGPTDESRNTTNPPVLEGWRSQEHSSNDSSLGQVHGDDGPGTMLFDEPETQPTTGGSDINSQALSFLQNELRRVVVYSPASFENRPSPPLSIHQEKTRRRETLKPKSIMKQSTRSTAHDELSRSDDQEESVCVPGQGAFARTASVQSLSGHLAPEEVGSEKNTSRNLNTASTDRQAGEETEKSLPQRSSKRRRSENTRGQGQSDGRSGGSKRPELMGALELISSPVEEPVAGAESVGESVAKSITSAQAQPRQVSRGSRMKRGSTTVTEFDPQSRNGALHETRSSANQSVLPRRANSRTYGSQKAESQMESETQSQSQLESQTRSRYWAASKESQDSITVSQDVGEKQDDSVYLFPGLAKPKSSR